MKIRSQGMVTSVGLNSDSSCAAIRCALTGFSETKFMFAGEWILAARTPLPKRWTGTRKLLEMACMAIQECMNSVDIDDFSNVALILCVSELDRPGRHAGLGQEFFDGIQRALGVTFHPESVIIARGKVGGANAIEYARSLMESGLHQCIVAGVDSLLTAQTLASLDDRRLLLTVDNSDGLIPGEAAAAVLFEKDDGDTGFSVLGIGFGHEQATLESGEPLRAEGLVHAFKQALREATLNFADIDYRLSDANGIQYGFKEGTLALARCMRPVKQVFDVWNVADCVGEIAAATVPLHIGYAHKAFSSGFAPGKTAICHLSNFGFERAALILGPEQRTNGQ